MGDTCGKPVKFTVEGKERYYQVFYKDDGGVESVSLYDGSGALIREFKTLEKLMAWVKRDTRLKERKRILDGINNAEKYTASEKRRLKDEWIPEEEKLETQAVFMKRLQQLCGEMSCKDFSEKLGLQIGVVRNYLLGWRFPSAHAMKRIADRCNVTVDWLLGRD